MNVWSRRILIAVGLVLLGQPGVSADFHHAWWTPFAVGPMSYALAVLMVPDKEIR